MCTNTWLSDSAEQKEMSETVELNSYMCMDSKLLMSKSMTSEVRSKCQAKPGGEFLSLSLGKMFLGQPIVLQPNPIRQNELIIYTHAVVTWE